MGTRNRMIQSRQNDINSFLIIGFAKNVSRSSFVFHRRPIILLPLLWDFRCYFPTHNKDLAINLSPCDSAAESNFYFTELNIFIVRICR